MRDSTRSLLNALMGHAAGALTAPGFELPGLTGFARTAGPWDVVTSAHAPDLPGDTFSFVALADGTLVVDEDVPEGSGTPLAEAVERELERPYEAVAVRREDDQGLWQVAAVRVLVAAAAAGDPSERVDLARVAGEVTATVDGDETSPGAAPAGLLELLAQLDGDAALTAERLDVTTWVAQQWNL